MKMEGLDDSGITAYYYHGDKLVAMNKGDDLRYIHQDHLSGTALTTDEAGAQVGTTMKYLPFGECRNSQPEVENFPTDKLFTGQRLDSISKSASVPEQDMTD